MNNKGIHIAPKIDTDADILVDQLLNMPRKHLVWKPITEPVPCSCVICVPDEHEYLEPMDA